MITCVMQVLEFENKNVYLGVVEFKNRRSEVLGKAFNLHSNST